MEILSLPPPAFGLSGLFQSNMEVIQIEPVFCGVGRVRTDDISLAKAALYQLSYDPMEEAVGFEPTETITSLRFSRPVY